MLLPRMHSSVGRPNMPATAKTIAMSEPRVLWALSCPILFDGQAITVFERSKNTAYRFKAPLNETLIIKLKTLGV